MEKVFYNVLHDQFKEKTLKPISADISRNWHGERFKNSEKRLFLFVVSSN